MMKLTLKIVTCLVLGLLINIKLNGQKTLTINVSNPGATIQPTMWGVFFEDINFAADGGIYAELVKNRSFQFYWPLMGWKTVNPNNAEGNILVFNNKKDTLHPRYVQISNQTAGTAYGLQNEGFRGMGIRKSEQYNIRIRAKTFGGEPVNVRCELLDSVKNIIGSCSVEIGSDNWAFYNTSMTASKTDPKGSLNVLIEGKGEADFNFISMFPEHTWKNRKNGLRADLVQMLADLHPGFMRFPGGCIVEGHELSTRYRWKNTIGLPENRKVQINRWNQEFKNREAPDYFQSFGLGFYEYFLLAEDIGAEPVPILNCGMACQYNTCELVPLNQLGPYIQDALDLIEFANGDSTTQWGKIRASMGHLGPFNLKFLGIGNEQWGSQYVERYKIFAKAIREKYPDIKLISGSGPSPSDERFHYLWSEMKNMDADLVDEHYYMNPDWFYANAGRYDNYDRKGPAVFAGEYASHTNGDKYPTSRNNWLSALSEAAFMTGLERNADIVHLSSYAPLFANIDAWQWNPDLIWFNSLKVMATPNYYVQKMYSTHKGTEVVPVTLNGETVHGQDSLYASTTVDEKTGKLYIKLVNASVSGLPLDLMLKGSEFGENSAIVNTLHSDDLTAYNTLEDPDNIKITRSTVKVKKNELKTVIGGRTFLVIEATLK